jgi:transcriptional regulator with XRE-family HTH domain
MKRYRLLLGLSQAQLAEKAGISVGYVGEVEMGRKFPSAEKLENIARALGVKPYRLLMGPEDLADATGGAEVVYETAERLKERLSREIDDFIAEVEPKNGKAGSRGKRSNGR